ncbi:MAG: CRISPR-associated endonuclease Cas3'' [Alphaproteobacteria bacterium]
MARLSSLFTQAGQQPPETHVLMGGADNTEWRVNPERATILVGTQDMLLSRALMRGYGMSRFGWPIDFGLLHTDALWVFDEVQLMGSGLATSAQLEAFRRRLDEQEGCPPARNLWVSATLRPEWLRTVDFRNPSDLRILEWDIAGSSEPASLTRRLDAIKRIRRADTRVPPEHTRKGLNDYARMAAREVLALHRKGLRTLVIVNQVQRAQAIYQALRQAGRPEDGLVLIHSRFRHSDRERIQQAISDRNSDQIVVATQAIEAGIDVTSAVLFTELAPWASLVQRFGRCNREGELNDAGGAEIRWIDAAVEEAPALARPYDAEDLGAARRIAAGLENAAPRNLPAATRGPQSRQVLRHKDFLELFDTDPDLSGYDLDISPFVRDADDTDVSLFWRAGIDPDRKQEPPRDLAIDVPPNRDELCRASIGQVREWLSKRRDRPLAAYVEDPNARGGVWRRLDMARLRLRPGLVLLLDAGAGGYDTKLGLMLDIPGPVPEARPAEAPSDAQQEIGPGAATDADPLSNSTGVRRDVGLELHLSDVAREAAAMAEELRLPSDLAAAVVRAAAWHDLGKAHPAFQERLGNADASRGWLAKSASPPVRNAPRPYFRHELASALAFLQQHEGEPHADLIAYLIAAHHGKVRMGIRALPDEDKPQDVTCRFARGVWDSDRLPALRCGDEEFPGGALSLALMEMGEDECGRPSWAARTQALLQCHGPFRLAYLEALLRMADWRASAAEQETTADGD